MDELEKMRNLLNSEAEKHSKDLTCDKVLTLSQEVDKLILVMMTKSYPKES